jgi:hypothetical protein
MLNVVAYSKLSRADSTDIFERIKPDLIIADEAHNLKNPSAACSKRVIRYFEQHPNTRFCAWSGTLTTRSIKDYAHLSKFALKNRSPLPLRAKVVEEWASAIDPQPMPAPQGYLRLLCKDESEGARDGLKRRMVSAPGVVATNEAAIGTSLIINGRSPKVPEIVLDMLRGVRTTDRRPDGEELVTPLDRARCAREVACGFYYRWRWPRGESPEVIFKWLGARKDWHRELRDKLKYSKQYLDSPLLCAKAAIRHYHGGCPHCHREPERPHAANCEGLVTFPLWEAECWPEWEKLRDTAQPETEAVWVDEFLADDSAQWIKSNVGIVWYIHDAFGKKVAEKSGAPLYGPGKEASETIIKEKGERSIIASIRAHGTGKNLQAFTRNLIANPPADGVAWEQLLGRTHRPGQMADEVEATVYRHTSEVREAFDKAQDLALYIEQTMGPQKLRYATRTF